MAMAKKAMVRRLALELDRWPVDCNEAVGDWCGWTWHDDKDAGFVLAPGENGHCITEREWDNMRRQLWRIQERRMDTIGQNGNDGLHYGQAREFNPITSSSTNSQAREAAEITGCCSDGVACGTPPNPGDDAYCDECPNRTTADPTNPGHYRAGKVECIDALESATVNKTGIQAVCTANAIKYLWRYESKNGIEDVRKARWYVERLLAALEAAE